MTEMCVWEVGLELQWKQTWKEKNKEKSVFWEENDVQLSVAASSGREAIIKAEKLALAQESWAGEHILDDDTTVPSLETPHKVLDVVSLELKEILDG